MLPSPESVTRMFESVVNEWGRLDDVLVNNAGIFPRARVVDLDLATWTRTIDVNLKGTFLGSQAAARLLIAQGRGGRIVNVASVSAFEPAVRQAHYAASKAGIVAFSRDLALELAPYRITVNVLAPGLVNTAQPRQDDVTEEQLAARGAAVPLGHMAEPEEMVPAVLFLCSEGGARTSPARPCTSTAAPGWHSSDCNLSDPARQPVRNAPRLW